MIFVLNIFRTFWEDCWTLSTSRPRMDANGLQPLNPSWRKSTFDEIFAQFFDEVTMSENASKIFWRKACFDWRMWGVYPGISLWESLMLWFSSTGGMLVVHWHQQMWQTSRSKETTGGTRPRRCLRSTLSLWTLSVLDVYRTQRYDSPDFSSVKKLLLASLISFGTQQQSRTPKSGYPTGPG